MLSSLFVIILSYLLGSIPFGYILSKIAGKNILEVGWRKTSGSNVFKNVGKLQGTATGIFDAAKGWLAVFLAQSLGVSLEIQAICGAAAVTGHNWSIFLKFAGGRGIGTFLGALLAFSPEIFGLSVVPLISLALIWNASIGTIFFLAASLYLAVHFNQFETVGIFTLVSLLPIFIKRLSPIGELSLSKKEVIKNRLIFDDDVPCFDLRIRRILSRLTKK